MGKLVECRMCREHDGLTKGAASRTASVHDDDATERLDESRIKTRLVVIFSYFPSVEHRRCHFLLPVQRPFSVHSIKNVRSRSLQKDVSGATPRIGSPQFKRLQFPCDLDNSPPKPATFRPFLYDSESFLSLYPGSSLFSLFTPLAP